MIWAVVVLFGVFVSYAAHSLFKYTRMISNIFLGLVYSPDEDLSVLSVVGEKITIWDSGDHEIEAVAVQAHRARGIVVFCHESGSNKMSWEKYAFFLPQKGFHVVAPDTDLPKQIEESNGLSQWPEEREVNRLEVVVRWARRAYGNHLPVILFGVSKGANLALALSTREPSILAVVTDGLFSMKEIFRDYIRKWGPILVRPNLFGERYPDWIVYLFAALGFWNSSRITKKKFVDVEKLLQKPHPPMLMIHGELDDYIPESHQNHLEQIARRTTKKNKTKFNRLQIPQAKHNQSVALARGAYERMVLDFLEKQLP